MSINLGIKSFTMLGFPIMRLTLECGLFGFSEFNFLFGGKMYNTWDIACNLFPVWAAIMLWLIYLLFRGEKPSTELVVSTRKEFYSKCYENEFIDRTAIIQADKAIKQKLESEGKWIEMDYSKGREETDYSKVPKTKKGFDHVSNIPNRNHVLEGYKAFKESKKEVITKPISLIPEYTTIYDIELTRGEYEKEYCEKIKKSKSA